MDILSNSLEDLLPELMKLGMKVLLIAGAIILVLYTIQAVILSETHKLRYGRKSFMAWIPGLNFYILGKVAFNRLIGLLLLICVSITGTITFGTPGQETIVSILPKDINHIINSILPYVIIVLYVIAIIRYKILLNKGGIDNNAAKVVSKKTLKVPSNDQ